MPRLRVVHKAPGYEAWKDEKRIGGPNWRVIVGVLLSCFVCGSLCSVTATLAYSGWANPDPVTAVPTLVSMEMITTPSRTLPPEVVVMQVEPRPTNPPPPTAAPTEPPPPTAQPTDNLQATMDFLLSQPTITPLPTTGPPVFCDGATFTAYPDSAVLVVTFQNKGALRLLDRPRTGGIEPTVLKQLYDGDQVVIQGEPVCGAWQGSPVAYYPVFVPRWDRSGWVGFGQAGDVWLEARR